ncbi:hypothetical protein HNO86_23435 [Pseudomonas sp. C1C7]|uniref:hypothetical protein n=1 Tax=Pseudomonas sp. C1C7 TaxID=2735272 RepID=UPI00158625D8|nr:hypothetical protein [Pseudomonas sp. C1C7]NUT77997.1 hypothetical protein [Pseudomonas sp. C1C7]
MAGQSTLAVLLAALAAVMVVLAVVLTAAAAAMVSAATLTAIGLAGRFIPEIQPLAGLAITPYQATLMAGMQACGLTTITEVMHQINWILIRATL